ncbi:MAG: epoxyqueuosine reductase [Firmicutes bacterium]|nr:epoxyqueuosine reductase [Bacillota bacterium]
MEWQERLKQAALEHGWDYFGVAEISKYHDYMATFCGDFIRQFPRAISLVIRLADAVVDPVESQEQDKILSFHNYIYYAVDYLQNTGTVKLARAIEKNGWKAFPVPASYNLYPSKQAGLVSHKLVARLAGLGWIGKNSLFLTPNDGPRVRLATILTDAPLATGTPMESKCRGCHLCVEACPGGAIHGREFNENEPDELRLDPVKCKQFIENRKKEWGIVLERCVCGMCVAICPYGKQRSGRRQIV